MRVVLGFLVAPLVPAVIAGLMLALSFPVEAGPWFFAALLAYPIAWFVGGPAYWLLRRKKWLRGWQVASVSTLIGTCVPLLALILVLAILVLAGGELTPTELKRAANNYSVFVAVGTACGFACGVAFWLLAIVESPFERRTSEHAHSEL
jgi:MFS family permease